MAGLLATSHYCTTYIKTGLFGVSKMGRDTLTRKATRAVIRTDEKVSDIRNLLSDISMKLCYLIRKSGLGDETGKGDYFGQTS